jgi:hypothetical protein
MSKKPKKKQSPKPYRANWRFGILNRDGDIWTPETFDTAVAASRYLNARATDYPSWNLRRHKIAPVRVTVSVRSGAQSSTGAVKP